MTPSPDFPADLVPPGSKYLRVVGGKAEYLCYECYVYDDYPNKRETIQGWRKIDELIRSSYDNPMDAIWLHRIAQAAECGWRRYIEKREAEWCCYCKSTEPSEKEIETEKWKMLRAIAKADYARDWGEKGVE